VLIIALIIILSLTVEFDTTALLEEAKVTQDH